MKKTWLPHRAVRVWLVLAFLVSGCNDPGSVSTASTASTASAKAASLASSSSGSATLSWEAPTTNTDGTALTDLAGYRIYYGSDAANLDQSVQINSVGVLTYVLDNLASGTWYFAIMAVTSTGNESVLSNVVEHRIS